MAEQMESIPRIVESFQAYTPPFDAKKAIHRMLGDTPPRLLHGLHSVVLTNSGALSRKERDRKTWGVAVLRSVTPWAITVRSGEASLHTSLFFWTISKSEWAGNDFANRLRELGLTLRLR